MRIAVLLLVSLWAGTPRAQELTAGPDGRIEVDIQPQAMADAILKYADEAGLTVMVDGRAGIGSVMSPHFQGRYKPEEGLRELLASRGLTAELKPPGIYIVRRAPLGTGTLRASTEPPEPSKPAKVEEVVVSSKTGTNLSVSPDASSVHKFFRADMDGSGVRTVDGYLRAIPMNFPLVNPETSTGATVSPLAGTNIARGTAISLWGAGPQAVLVLVNGQRLAPSGFDGSLVDISMIPFSALDRIEMLSDGASAIYGSDAVAGVVNFVLRRDFEGLQTSPYYRVMSGWRGLETGFSQLAGHRWSSGGFMLAFEKSHQDAVDASSRIALTPQSTAFEVLPSQGRQNGVLTLHQNVSSRTEVLANLLWSERAFDQVYPSAPMVSTESRGRAKMLDGSFKVVQQLPDHWKISFTGATAEEEETVNASVSSLSQPVATRSSVSSLDWLANGRIFRAPGGDIEVSAGFSWRWETFNDLMARLGPSGTGVKRAVRGTFGEAHIPFIDTANQTWWAKRLGLWIALRRDDYRIGDAEARDAGSSNPKFGVAWSPLSMLNLRSTYGRSFRMPTLAQQSNATDTVALLPFPGPTADSAPINTLYLIGGNNTLRPEVATSWTAGFDLGSIKPTEWNQQAVDKPEWSISCTYFHLTYTDRIAAPPEVGPVTSIFSQLGALSPYVDTHPSDAAVQAVYDQHSVLDPAGIGKSGVQAIFDSRQHNIAATKSSGVEMQGRAKIPSQWGTLDTRLQGQYLRELYNQAAPGTAFVPLVGTVFNPPRWRAHADVSWSKYGWQVSSSADYTGRLRNTLTAGAPDVASWLTFNVRLAYDTGRRLNFPVLDNLELAVSANNVMNRSAPYVQGLPGLTLGYDPANSSALGRTVLFEIRKTF